MANNQAKNKERPVVDSVKTGEFLAALRKAAGYTQQEVADDLNITNKTISKWESGAGLPEISILPAVAELYGVTVDEILAGKRLERFVEKETADGPRSGKSENPEKTAARRKWLEETVAVRFHTAQIVLWGTMLVGTILCGALFLMAEPYRRFPEWTVIVGWLIWMVIEAVGVVIFWIWHTRTLKTVAQEDEEKAQKLPGILHGYAMRLLIPFLVSLAVLVPLMLQNEDQATFVGVERWQTLSQTLWLYTGLSGTIKGYIFQWLMNIPAAGLIVSVVGVMIDLIGKMCLTQERGPVRKSLRKLLVIAACFLTGMLLLNTAISRVSLINYKSFPDQTSFDRYINEYFFLYNSYRLHGSHDGPELSYGVEKIDCQWLDSALDGGIGHEEYEGVVAIDYDNLKIWRVGTVVERQMTAGTMCVVTSAISGLSLLLFWFMYFKKKPRKDCQTVLYG